MPLPLNQNTQISFTDFTKNIKSIKKQSHFQKLLMWEKYMLMISLFREHSRDLTHNELLPDFTDKKIQKILIVLIEDPSEQYYILNPFIQIETATRNNKFIYDRLKKETLDLKIPCFEITNKKNIEAFVQKYDGLFFAIHHYISSDLVNKLNKKEVFNLLQTNQNITISQKELSHFIDLESADEYTNIINIIQTLLNHEYDKSSLVQKQTLFRKLFQIFE